MGKPPRSRHSRTSKDPVTIDLDASDIERVGDNTPPAGEAAFEPAHVDGDSGVADQTADLAPEPDPAAGEADAGAAAVDDVWVADRTYGDADTPADTATQETTAEAPAGDRTDASNSPPDLPPPPARSDRVRTAGRGSALAAGVAGGAIIVALAAALQWSGVLPSPVPAPASDPVTAELRAEVQELRQALAEQPAGTGADELARMEEALAAAQAEIGALSARFDEQPAGLQDLEPRLEALETTIGDLGDAAPADGLLAGIDERVAGLEAAIAGLGDATTPDAAPQEAVAALEDRLAELEATIASVGQQAAPEADLEAVDARLAAIEQALAGEGEATGRIEVLETTLQSLREQLDGVVSMQEEQAGGPRAALVIAASALRAAIERGGAFRVELDTFAALAPQTEGLEELSTIAGTGVATRDELLAELPSAADRMVAAARPQSDQDGFLDSLWQSAQDLVSVRPVGSVEGDSAAAIVARVEVAIRAGDYETALSEYAALPDGSREAGRAFMERVETRHRADVVTERALAEALRPAEE